MMFGVQSTELTGGVFLILRELIRERTGLWYDDDKATLLADRLLPRLSARCCPTFLDYYHLLRYDPAAGTEWLHLMDALAVRETYFWRGLEQVKVLVDRLVRQHVANRPGQPLRIWSAGCATGEEPLTLVMALAEAGWFERLRIEIVGSDASPAALAEARAGLYGERSFRALPEELRRKYFVPENGAWRADSRLHARIRWARVNLLDETEIAPYAGSEIVFCRNVFIYFAPDAIATTVQRLAQRMPRPGYLFVSPSESLWRSTADFELEQLDEAFVYVLPGAIV